MKTHQFLQQGRARLSLLANPASATRGEGGAFSSSRAGCELVAVGGCHGLVLIPVEEIADFYKGYQYVALLALSCLALYLAIGVLA